MPPSDMPGFRSRSRRSKRVTSLDIWLDSMLTAEYTKWLNRARRSQTFLGLAATTPFKLGAVR